MGRLPVVKYEGGIWASAQPSAEEFRRFAALGAKSVLVIIRQGVLQTRTLNVKQTVHVESS
jgi:hypothetical protein